MIILIVCECMLNIYVCVNVVVMNECVRVYMCVCMYVRKRKRERKKKRKERK